MASDLTINKEYKAWLAEIKLRIRTVQIKAAVSVNSELLRFYWGLGADIVAKQTTAKWGDGFLPQLSRDLMAEFPEMKGFSERNLKYVRQWYLFYSHKKALGQQLVAPITAVPWRHNIAIIAKCKDVEEALYYVQNTRIHNWSRSVLVHQIESGLYQREGKSVNNFSVALPKPQSDSWRYPHYSLWAPTSAMPNY